MLSVNEVKVKVVKEFRDLFKKNLKNVFLTRVTPTLRIALMAAYDKLASQEAAETPAAVASDFTLLSNVRHIFEKQLNKELAEPIILDDGNIEVNLLNEALLGFGRKDGFTARGSADSVDWLSYYIDGMIGEFAFINRTSYEKRRPDSSGGFGRFGTGFLIPKDRYISELWERHTGLKFSDVRHPISGQKPYKGFEQALDGINFTYFVEQALAETTATVNANN